MNLVCDHAPLRCQSILLSPLMIPEVQIKDLIALTCHDQLFALCRFLQIVRFSRKRSFFNISNSPKCPGVTLRLRHAMAVGCCVAMAVGAFNDWCCSDWPGILRRLESTQMRPNICSRWDLSILTLVPRFGRRSTATADPLQNPGLRWQRLP